MKWFTIVLLCLGASGAAADTAPALQFDGATILQAAPMARSAGGYVEITNTGDTPDRLTGVLLDGAPVELHESLVDADGVARMEPRPDGFAVAPGDTLRLARGGKHIMFMGLETPFTPGENVPLVLVFEAAGDVTVGFEVATPRTMPDGHAEHGGTDGHAEHGGTDGMSHK